MDEFIKLKKTKYILINKIDNVKLNKSSLIDIMNVNTLKQEKMDKEIVFTLDFDKINNKQQFKKMMKNIIKIKKYARKNNIGIKQGNEILIGVLKNYNKDNNFQREIIYSINAIFFDNVQEKYEYIYDKICEYLDNEFIKRNLCGFENDKCIAKKNTQCTMGCCHNYRSIFSNEMIICKYLKNKTCSANCISCKLFTCDYLKKQGIQFKINDILLADYFFNFMQKLVIKTKVFTPKEKIIKQILFFYV